MVREADPRGGWSLKRTGLYARGSKSWFWGGGGGGAFSRPGEALICPLATDLLGHTERATVTAED